MNANKLLRLKGQLSRKKKGGGGSPGLGELKKITVSNIDKLINNLVSVRDYFKFNQTYFSGVLLNAEYYTVVSKSRRISTIFSGEKKGGIVGVRFNEKASNDRNHVITYLLSFDEVNDSIRKLENAKEFLMKIFKGSIDSVAFKDYINKNKSNTNLRVIVDVSNVEAFSRPVFTEEVNDTNIVSFYEVNKDIPELLTKLGVSDNAKRASIGNNTFLLNRNDLNICVDKADYLISMSLDPFTIFDFKDDVDKIDIVHTIPSPKNEPTIGVIDTFFDSNAYFSEWVDERPVLDYKNPAIEDKMHATKVASIIVDGPSLNPHLDDGCGRFKVRLFEVARKGKNNSLFIIESIEKIIRDNQDIHVWNLSLGSDFEISKNYISPGAASLDELQTKYNVLFVVSATNEENVSIAHLSNRRIGAPADSINSIVVGSCNSAKEPALYSRKGGVLSFFIKPDVLYYGGDYFDKPLITNDGFKDCKSQGTSFAAPWISRKASYLIDILGFDRETAKALLIDSAVGWDSMPSYSTSIYCGYGVVPIKIQDVVNSENDEIKFYFKDTIETYYTGTLMIPVPVDDKNKFPFNIKATLCYFANCDRKHGVDYTLTEMDLRVGVVEKGTIRTINKNVQADDGSYIREELARNLFRKWDTTKHISEKLTKIGKKVYETNRYGFMIDTKERLHNTGKYGYSFALVITLKEQKGLNRQEQFIRECQSSGWIVVPVEIEDNINVYNESQDDVKLE